MTVQELNPGELKKTGSQLLHEGLILVVFFLFDNYNAQK